MLKILGLQNLSFDDLKVFTKLKYLKLPNNKLTILKKDLFSYNILMFILAPTIVRLTKLAHIDLKHNSALEKLQTVINSSHQLVDYKKILQEKFGKMSEIFYTKLNSVFDESHQ
jgi:hypothetical protein